LFRSGDAIQRLARIRAVCFDKTGTLTTGDSDVIAFTADAETEPEIVLAAARVLAAGSSDVQGQERSSESALPAQLQTRPGRGLRGSVPGISQPVYLGSLRWMHESGLEVGARLQDRIDAIQAAGRPLTCVGWSGRVRGVFEFDEQLRDEAAAALQELRDGSLHVSILTGDHASRAALLQRSLGLAVASEMLPEDKAAAIQAARNRYGPVAMVGDGLNDAPALASADVGIALGCGADVSRDAAQVCLLGNDLRRISWSMRLASRTLRTVHTNLFWAFFYNLIGIVAAAAGWLNPIWAAGAMVISSLFVVSNSLRLSGSCDDV
jgi:cation transport ATPase